MRATVSCVLFGLLLSGGFAAAQDQPLHKVIDSLLSPASGLTTVCSDAEFLRRVSLDLTGMPPSTIAVREFLADESADKRMLAVDRLLATPQYTRHMATTLDLMLMERRSNAHVPQDDWHNWLLTSLRDGKPWNVMAREILTADGDDPSMRPAARFFLDRQSEPHLLTRDIGRIFFGRDLQCAQCHDHPLISDYLQADYHGLLAFLAPGYAIVRKETVQEGDKQTTKEVTLHAEKAGSDLTFESVFIQGTLHRTGPRLFDNVVIDEPFAYPGEEYDVAPAEGIKSVPRFSRRAKLAEVATDGTQRMFNENMANRLWAHMLGRGLVHPVDLHHYDNPPTNPELLKQLGERFAGMNYDIRGLLREVALSQTYQRAFDPPTEMLAIATEAKAALSALEQEQALLQQAAEQSAATFELALTACAAAEAATLPFADELDAARKAYEAARKSLEEAQSAVIKAQADLDQKQAVLTPVQLAATATATATEKLPNDAELVAAAAQFTKRATELIEQVAALAKDVEVKTAAVASPTAALALAKPPIDNALARWIPLEETHRLAERALLEARRQMRRDAVALRSLEEHITVVRSIAALSDHHQQVTTASTAVAAREADQAVAQQTMDHHLTLLAECQAAISNADAALMAGNSSLTQAQTALSNRIEDVKAVTTAADTAQTASGKLPDDTVLAEVAQKLRQRADSLATEMGQFETAIESATVAVATADAARVSAQQLLDQSQSELPALQDACASAETALVAARDQVIQFQATYDTAVSRVTGELTSEFTLASLKPLTPEQLCWSTLQVTGVYDRIWKAEVAALDEQSPLTDEQKQDPTALAARNRELEQRTYDKLKGNLPTFIQFYGAASGQPQGDFFATADQALFASNGGAVSEWIAPAHGNVTERILSAEPPTIAIDDLYLTVFNRRPTEDETAEVVAYFSDRESDRAVAAQELVWGLLTSAEFRFNH